MGCATFQNAKACAILELTFDCLFLSVCNSKLELSFLSWSKYLLNIDHDSKVMMLLKYLIKWFRLACFKINLKFIYYCNSFLRLCMTKVSDTHQDQNNNLEFHQRFDKYHYNAAKIIKYYSIVCVIPVRRFRNQIVTRFTHSRRYCLL